MNSSAQQPMIVKYLESLHNGIQSQILSRYAIGYILRGTKYIYDGDKRQTLARGDASTWGSDTITSKTFPTVANPTRKCSFTTRPRTCSASSCT